MGTVITPAQVEAKLIGLSKEIDDAHDTLDAAEFRYAVAKAEAELAMARHRLALRNTDAKLSIQVRDDEATVANANLIKELAMAEALVKSARANAARLRTQVDIARSVGTSVRTGLDT